MKTVRIDTTNFQDMLEFVEGYAPDHALLPVLRIGYSILNARYLSNIVKGIYQAQEAAEAKADEDDEPILIDRKADEVEKAIIGQLRRFFADRAAQSNRFHDCNTQAERAAVSDEIQVIQRNIQIGMSRLRFYRLNGRLPDDGLSSYQPKDGFELVQKRNSLRASISIKRGDIKRDESLDQQDPRVQQRMMNHQTKLKQLQIELANVQEQIDKLHGERV